MQIFFLKDLFYVCRNEIQMSIYNISAIKSLMTDGNHYSYTRIKNLLLGLKGNSTKKDIQQVRKILKEEWLQIDNRLQKLENQ